MYQLKKIHGRNVDLYVRGAVSQNVETGVPTYPETKYKIKRVPVLEVKSIKADSLAQNFAVAGRSFEYGGKYNLNSTVILIEDRQLPDNYLANDVDNFIIDHKRFRIVDHKVQQENRLFVFIVEELEGQATSEIYDSKESFIASETVSYTIGKVNGWFNVSNNIWLNDSGSFWLIG